MIKCLDVADPAWAYEVANVTDTYLSPRGSRRRCQQTSQWGKPLRQRWRLLLLQIPTSCQWSWRWRQLGRNRTGKREVRDFHLRLVAVALFAQHYQQQWDGKYYLIIDLCEHHEYIMRKFCSYNNTSLHWWFSPKKRSILRKARYIRESSTCRSMLRKVRYFSTPPILSRFGASSSGTCPVLELLESVNIPSCHQSSPSQHSSANGRHRQSWQLQQPGWEGPPTSSAASPTPPTPSPPPLPPSYPASSPTSAPWQASCSAANATERSFRSLEGEGAKYQAGECAIAACVLDSCPRIVCIRWPQHCRARSPRDHNNIRTCVVFPPIGCYSALAMHSE